MTEQIFMARFYDIVEMWGTDPFSEPYKRRAVERTNDMHSEEIKQLNDLLIDNCERAPSIVKLTTYAAQIRARRPIPHQEEKWNQVSTVCPICDDMGVLVVSGSGVNDEIMSCSNEQCRASYYWQLPRFKIQYEPNLKARKVPRDWFGKPGEEKAERTKEWRTKLLISENFWRERQKLKNEKMAKSHGTINQNEKGVSI